MRRDVALVVSRAQAPALVGGEEGVELAGDVALGHPPGGGRRRQGASAVGGEAAEGGRDGGDQER